MRTFFEKPIREDTTLDFYPEKMSVEEFAGRVLDSRDAFVNNMLHMKLEDQYAEEWMETFCAWSEIEQE